MRGLSVFTRPSRISGNPRQSPIARTPMPAPASSRAVPPVETISTPRSASPRANSTRPRLSETVRSALWTRTSPGWVTWTGPWSVVAIEPSLDDHLARIAWIRPHPSSGYEPHGTRQEPVLDLVDPFLDRRDVTRIRKNVEGFLEDDRARVDLFVDEVDRHAHDLHDVVERLLDRPDSGERRQQRRVHVHDPAGEATDE